MFHHILCPIDFTTFSHCALQRAVELARTHGASVTGVHVVPLATACSLAGARRGLTPDDLDLLRAQVLKVLQEANAPSPTAVAVVGDPAVEIEKLAASLPADLIVMPLHGWTGFNAHGCGLVTGHVLCHAGTPVLIVPDAPVAA
jgi:nucleotide-binding universal stress UspA family protein